jgi:hypothetical protein
VQPQFVSKERPFNEPRSSEESLDIRLRPPANVAAAVALGIYCKFPGPGGRTFCGDLRRDEGNCEILFKT